MAHTRATQARRCLNACLSLLTTLVSASQSGFTTTPSDLIAATTDDGASSGALPVEVSVQGQSGKFTVYPKSEGPSAGIQITMDALREVDASGDPVGTQGSQKHSIQTFASQDFEIEDLEEVELDGGVLAAKVSFQSSVSNVGVIAVDTYVVAESGNVGPPGEEWSVRLGDLKWNIRLMDWTFCDGSGAGACKNGDVGEFIDLDISVKGLADAAVQGEKTVHLGGNTTLELSNQVFDGSTWSAMPAGYPSVAVQGSSTTITFRFPKFSDGIVYDPAIIFPDFSEQASTSASSQEFSEPAATSTPSGAGGSGPAATSTPSGSGRSGPAATSTPSGSGERQELAETSTPSGVRESQDGTAAPSESEASAGVLGTGPSFVFLPLVAWYAAPAVRCS